MEVAYIHAYWSGKTQNAIQGSYESQCSHFLGLILDDYQIESTESQQKGIYVASSDAGKVPSIEFWRSALDLGLSYASPKHFPWTLANSPCSYFARALNIQGPNYTLVGNGDAFIAAYKQAVDHLLSGEISEAIVLGIDFGMDNGNNAQFSAILLKKIPSLVRITAAQQISTAKEVSKLNPSEVLNLICDSIRLNEALTFGDNLEGFFRIDYML